jgi:predicted TIM-barrel fold metal-dependent hydrolase
MRCDSHIHIVGPTERYPQLANRTYTAGLATLEQLERAAAPRNVRRFVIVQPSFYGADNSLLMDGLSVLQERGRGVAVIEPGTLSIRELMKMKERGVRGLRINLYSPLGTGAPLPARFNALQSTAHEMDWHIEVIAPLKLIAQESALIASAKVPVVLDHYGLYTGFAPHRGEGRALIELLALPHIWMKLSAPYRSSYDALATHPDPIWLAEMLKAAPDRCVWGSDWPHTPPHEAQGDGDKVLPYRSLHYSDVFDDFCAAVGSVEACERILTDNAAKLYGFGS